MVTNRASASNLSSLSIDAVSTCHPANRAWADGTSALPTDGGDELPPSVPAS